MLSTVTWVMAMSFLIVTPHFSSAPYPKDERAARLPTQSDEYFYQPNCSPAVALRARPVSGPFIANDFPTMLGAAVEGVVLAQMPAPIASDAMMAGKLVRVLESFAPMAPGVFRYYPGHRQIMPKLRAFIDHVKSRSKVADKARIKLMKGEPDHARDRLNAVRREPSSTNR
jgi:DNA-binding transcriptional LysR family regulator